MKMHSPGHSSAASTTSATRLSGTVRGAVGAGQGRARAAVRAEDARPRLFLDVGEAVVVHAEERTGDLDADAVAGAEVLVDPHSHRGQAMGTRPRATNSGDGCRLVDRTGGAGAGGLGERAPQEPAGERLHEAGRPVDARWRRSRRRSPRCRSPGTPRPAPASVVVTTQVGVEAGVLHAHRRLAAVEHHPDRSAAPARCGRTG